MKIAILGSRFPFPLDRGDKLRLYNQIKELSRDNEIHLFCVGFEKLSDLHRKELEKYCRKISYYRISPFNRYFSIFKALFGRLPFQTAQVYSPKAKDKIAASINELNPDVIYTQLVRMVPYVAELEGIKVIDYMDDFSSSMRKRATVSKGLYKQMYRWESQRTSSYEREVFDYFDAHTMISKKDADSMLPEEDIQIISNGINFIFFEYSPQMARKYDVGFVGNMGYLPNVDAAGYLVNDILAFYTFRFKEELSVLIAGARPHEKVRKLESPQVNIAGWFEDIREAYSSIKVLVAPIFAGTGQQNKILEAMAMGTPVITTSVVNEAINATPEEQILIANNQEDFSLQIKKLLSSDELYGRIQQSARAFVEEEFSWQVTTDKLNRIFTQIKH